MTQSANYVDFQAVKNPFPSCKFWSITISPITSSEAATATVSQGHVHCIKEKIPRTFA